MDDVFESKVETLAFGGRGIVRLDGMVVFIPFALPDDLIKFRIVDKKSSYATGEILEILEPSPYRIEPPCPHFGICGGCQLQNLAYDKQLEHKKEALKETLKRIGHLDVDNLFIVPTEQQWAYRRHIHLTLKPTQHGFEMGYIGYDNKTMVPIRICPIFTEKETPLQQLTEMCKKFSAEPHNEGRATLLKQGDAQFIIHFHFKFKPENASEVIDEGMRSFNIFSGMILTTPKETLRWGKTTTTTELNGMKIEYSSQVFIQNHPEQSYRIYNEIIEIAKHFGIKNVLDLYCGIGTLTLMLAKQGANIVGIENNRESIKFAKKNQAENGIENCKFVLADVRNVIKEYLESPLDMVIVNPPREGLDKSVVESLCKHKPKYLIYVSCMPPTLARDLSALTKNGYRLSFVQAYDMFPQTAHLESLALLK